MYGLCRCYYDIDKVINVHFNEYIATRKIKGLWLLHHFENTIIFVTRGMKIEVKIEIDIPENEPYIEIFYYKDKNNRRIVRLYLKSYDLKYFKEWRDTMISKYAVLEAI